MYAKTAKNTKYADCIKVADESMQTLIQKGRHAVIGNRKAAEPKHSGSSLDSAMIMWVPVLDAERNKGARILGGKQGRNTRIIEVLQQRYGEAATRAPTMHQLAQARLQSMNSDSSLQMPVADDVFSMLSSRIDQEWSTAQGDNDAGEVAVPARFTGAGTAFEFTGTLHIGLRALRQALFPSMYRAPGEPGHTGGGTLFPIPQYATQLTVSDNVVDFDHLGIDSVAEVTPAQGFVASSEEHQEAIAAMTMSNSSSSSSSGGSGSAIPQQAIPLPQQAIPLPLDVPVDPHDSTSDDGSPSNKRQRTE